MSDESDADDRSTPAEPMTPDDVPDECELPDCEAPVVNFPEAFAPPPQVEAPTDDTGRLIMCDWHYVAARIMAFTRPDPPYVDVGLYKEVTYYSRALAAETFDLPSQEHVHPPENPGEDG